MSRRLVVGFAAPLCALALAACDAGDKAPKEDAPKGPSVRITSPRMDQVLDTGDAMLMLDVRDYVVGEAEKQANGAGYAKGSGQHVHVILDNLPYLAVYDVSKGIDLRKARPKSGDAWPPLEEGTHVVRVFPSAGPNDPEGRQWHESRKNAGALAWVRFHVRLRGDPRLQEFDADARPTLTYSRPKGEYVRGGTDGALLFPLMLDFYVSGTTLAKDGHRVAATFDGKALDPITEWKPVSLPEAAPGEHTVVLELVDKDGKPVEGPFNRTERKITVK
jgi:hypothetical protein